MENNPINSLIDLLAVSEYSRVQLSKVIYQQGGHLIIPAEFLGFVGGNITQITPDQHGRIIYKNLIVSPLLACGHVTKSINEIAGTCFICKRLICTQCLLTCDLSGVPVCPRHSTIKDGVVIGNHAKKGLWRLKVRRIREDKELGYDVRKQISYE
ncbi:MAG TPA: hypothetical protein ENI23_16775 [bacterium]|nr:hypothetical protein [bacterium]